MSKALQTLHEKTERFIEHLSRNFIDYDPSKEELKEQLAPEGVGYVYKYDGKHIFQIMHNFESDNVTTIDFITDKELQEMTDIHFGNNSEPETKSVKVNGHDITKATVLSGDFGMY